MSSIVIPVAKSNGPLTPESACEGCRRPLPGDRPDISDDERLVREKDADTEGEHEEQ